MPTLPRNNSGLLYKDDFSLPTGWTAGTGWAFDASLPTYCMFDPTPLTFEYTPGGIDGGGAREFHLFIDSDGAWYLFYGTGDNASNVAWRVYLAKSTDRGLTWTKLGPLNIQLQTGTGGNYAARDMLYMEKRGSTYYLHAMSAGSAQNGVPVSPYQSQMWTNTTCAATGWTFQNAIVGTNSLGNGTDNSDDYSGCVVKVGAVYHLFASTRSTSNVFGVSHFTANGPNGDTTTHAWTPHSTNPNPVVGGANIICENPKVFYSPALSKWVMLLTHSTYPTAPPNNGDVLTSADLVTWTPSSAPGLITMHPTPLHGTGVGPNIPCPLYGIEGAPILDANSYVPCTYDCDAAGGFPDAGNSGHRGRFVVGEPALNCLHFTPNLTTLDSDNFSSYAASSNIVGQGGWIQATGTSGSIVATSTALNLNSSAGDTSVVNSNTTMQDGTAQADLTIATGTSVGFILRYVDNTHFNLIDIGLNGTGWTIGFYRGGNAYTAIGSALNGPANSWASGATHTVSVAASGNNFVVSIDGSAVATLTDSVTTPVAGKVGLRNGQGGTGTRLADNFLVTTGSSASSTCYRALAHGDFVAEYAVEFPAVGAGSVGFDFHVQDANNLMRLLLTYNGKLTLQRTVAGVTTTLPLNTGAINTATGYLHYVRVESFAGKITALLDGEKQISYSDTTFATGTQIGFYASGGAEARVRTFHVRQGNTVTLQGLTPGHTIVPRTPGGLPTGSYVVPSSGILSFNYSHFPLASISDNGTDYTPADGGSIWGGDNLGAASTTTTTKIITRRTPTRGRN